MENPDFYETWNAASDEERWEAFTKASPTHGVPFHEFIAGPDLSGLLPESEGVTAWSQDNPDVVDLRGAGPVVRAQVLPVVRILRKRMGLDPDGKPVLED